MKTEAKVQKRYPFAARRSFVSSGRNRERQGMMPRKPEYPTGEKFPTEALKSQKEQSAEQAKVRDMAKRSMKKGKLTKGNRRRA